MTAARISIPFPGAYWAERQLDAAINNVPTRWILMELQGYRSQIHDGR